MRVTCIIKENSWEHHIAVLGNGCIITKQWLAEVGDKCEHCGKLLEQGIKYYCTYSTPLFCSANCVVEHAKKNPDNYKIINVLPWEIDED